MGGSEGADHCPWKESEKPVPGPPYPYACPESPGSDSCTWTPASAPDRRWVIHSHLDLVAKRACCPPKGLDQRKRMKGGGAEDRREPEPLIGVNVRRHKDTFWPGDMEEGQSCHRAPGPSARSGEMLTSWEAAS